MFLQTLPELLWISTKHVTLKTLKCIQFTIHRADEYDLFTECGSRLSIVLYHWLLSIISIVIIIIIIIVIIFITVIKHIYFCDLG